MPPEPPARQGACPIRIGKYQILAHIASGGMGSVYRATDTDSGREIALKILAPTPETHVRDIERFRREAARAAKLDHENVVKLYDSGEFENLHFLALEFVDGVDLKDYVARKGKVRPEKARRLILQAANALGHVHEHGIIHRDIKPSNFLLMRRNGKKVVKLTDLGLSRETDDDECRLTRANHTLGTIDYMAPEQARDSSSADIRSDIYSLGCTLYHLLAGHPPFPDGGPAERIYKHCEVQPTDIRKLTPSVPDGFAHILSKMLAKNPGRRYQTTRELIADLKNPNNFRVPVRTEFLEDLTDEAEEPKRRPSRGSDPVVRAQQARKPRRRDERPVKKPVPEDIENIEDTDDDLPQEGWLATLSGKWALICVIGAGLLLAAIAIALYEGL